MWPVHKIREDFPILVQNIHGHPLAYLDNAATTQKPQCVLDVWRHYYQHDNANVHRGVHTLSVRATEAYEQARDDVAAYLNAPKREECIFVRGATEAINLVAEAYLAPRLHAGDEIILTTMEHHSNIVPWQRLAEKHGARLVIVPVDDHGDLDLDAYAQCLSSKTRFVALTYVSNALGTINPVSSMVALAHQVGAKVLVDGAQAMPHFRVDLQALGVDFFVFSGHKAFAPTGIGILWGKAELLNAMEPYQSGGEMIRHVSFEHTTYAPIPAKFEAGTPNISGAIALGRALNYLASLDAVALQAYEHKLLSYATEQVLALKDFQIIGQAQRKVPVLSFVHPTIHAHDIGTILDNQGVAIRSGHHCAMPLMTRYGLAATSRISLAFYNTMEEIDQCIQALHYVRQVFA